MVMCARLHLPRESAHPTHEPVIPRGVITEKPMKLARDAYKTSLPDKLKRSFVRDLMKAVDRAFWWDVLTGESTDRLLGTIAGCHLFESRFARVD